MTSLIPSLIVEIITTLSGVVITVGVPLIIAKINKFEKLYTTVFGLEEVDNIDGLVGIVEVHDKEIADISSTMEEMSETQEQMMNNQQDVMNRIEQLEKSIKERNGE